MSNPFKVATCNISGLQDKGKRASVFNWLKSQQCDIVFLQETHCHLNKEVRRWSHEWDAQCIWSKGTNKSRGVAVLFNPKYSYQVKNEIIDSNGRYIIFDLEICEVQYRFINIYSPNDSYERVKFINDLNMWIDPDIETFIGGDFNCTQDSSMDRLNCTNSRDIGQVDITHIKQTHMLEDIWRRRNPGILEFSWQRGTKASRIDYWLISESMDSKVDTIEYIPCVYSDHKFLKMNFRTSDSNHGTGAWKMNVSVIKSELFQNTFNTIWKTWGEQKSNYHNINFWWDLGKKKIKD